MQITLPLARSRRRSTRRSAIFASSTAAPARERNQRANVSQDAALYSCSCGYVFKAAVTTSVAM